MGFVTDLSYVLQQPSTARLAKTKADIAKKSSHFYSSHCLIQFHASHSIQYYFRRFDRINSPIFVAITRESQRQLTMFNRKWDKLNLFYPWMGLKLLNRVCHVG